MPIGVVDYANATQTMPWNLASAFSRSDTIEGLVVMNQYNGGESQRVPLVADIRNIWTVTFRLTDAKLKILRDFWIARGGPHEPFYFYDVTETVGFAYDETGASATGRHTVRFDGEWDQQLGVGHLRGTITVRLVELAGPAE